MSEHIVELDTNSEIFESSSESSDVFGNRRNIFGNPGTVLNLNLRSVAKQSRKFTCNLLHASFKKAISMFLRLLQFCTQSKQKTCIGWPNGENVCLLAHKVALVQIKWKSSQVDASFRPLASVWPGLKEN